MLVSDEFDHGNRAVSRMSAKVRLVKVLEDAKLGQALGVLTVGDKLNDELVTGPIEH